MKISKRISEIEISGDSSKAESNVTFLLVIVAFPSKREHRISAKLTFLLTNWDYWE